METDEKYEGFFRGEYILFDSTTKEGREKFLEYKKENAWKNKKVDWAFKGRYRHPLKYNFFGEK